MLSEPPAPLPESSPHDSCPPPPQVSSLLDAAPGMTYRRVNDGKWSLAYVSRGSQALLGYAPGEMTADGGRAFTDFVHPSCEQSFLGEAAKAAKERRAFGLAYVTRHKKGLDKWVWDQGEGVYDEGGRLLYVDGFVSDYSRRGLISAATRRHQAEIDAHFNGFRFGGMVGRSQAMHRVYEAILKVAESDQSVIIYGESGTGKELAAREVHRTSARAHRAFVPINCGAIPDNLMESELFGYRKGAFSGADKDKPGLLEAADGGTLFLDEIGEIPLAMQVKLLRALEGDGFTPMGGCDVIRPDLRIVAATNRDLAAMVQGGQLRADFYYRVNVLPLHLPPLRQRKEDLPLLSWYFLKEAKVEMNIPGETLKAIMRYDWPGNVRELRNQVRHFAALGHMDIPTLRAGAETGGRPAPFRPGQSLQECLARCEAEVIAAALREYRWNRSRTAQALGIDRRTLFEKIRRYALAYGGS